MVRTKLQDGTPIYCLIKSEAQVLDHHVEGYFSHGIQLHDGDIVFDVGANVGVFCLRAIQKGSTIRVFAFEPIPEIYACLQKNAEVFGDGRFVALPYGVSNGPGTLQFSYYPNSPALSTSSPDMWDEETLEDAVEGTLRNPPPHMWWMAYIPKFFGRFFARRMRKNAKTYTCQLESLSTIIAQYEVEKIDLLKLDCEGAELAALQGIQQDDWAKIKQVVVEVHDIENRLQTIQDMLKTAGFTEQVVEKEKSLEKTALYNVYARRSV